MPKQIVKIFGDRSLFQLTVERNRISCDRQLIVSNTEQYFLAADQLAEIDSIHHQYLLEPVGRNTAPAIGLACLVPDPEETVLVTPSDHKIENTAAYLDILKKAKALAREGYLVTFGITPTFPETGFGYIESENTKTDDSTKDGAAGQTVRAFHEKPDLDTASAYLKAGNYYWNSGMFCFKAGVLLDELAKYAPDILQHCRRALASAVSGSMTRIRHKEMLAIPEQSIDYAVMEKSDRVKVIPADIGWSDVGSFDALAAVLSNDNHNNFILSHKPTHLIDIENLIVVDTDDALLICAKGSSQKVKDIVRQYQATDSSITHTHRKVYRPWGTYTVLEDARGYKIKHIEVSPGKRLSLQKHLHRNEHWIVLSGTATVTVGNSTHLIQPNESTYIKAGEVHRLANEGKIPLLLIEAQVGEYTGEDDIIRLDDDFQRGKA